MSSLRLDPATEKIVAAGREAWARLKRDEVWYDWVATGRAIEAGKIAMMNYLGTNNPRGRKWSDHWGAWLKEQGFDDIDKGVRTRLQKCMDRLSDIERWRANIGMTQAQKYNHPNSVWDHFTRDTGVTTDGAAKPAPGSGLRGEVARLREELDTAHRRIQQLERADNNMLLIARDAKPEEILAVLEHEVPGKLGTMWTLIGQRLNATTPTAGSVKVKRPRAAKPDHTTPASGS